MEVSDIKVPEVPVVAINPETPADEPLIDNRRAEIEKLVIAENETLPEPEVVPDEPKEAPKVDPKAPEESAEQRIKNAVQKRIDKVIAQKKTVEEQLAEANAEIERLKANPKQPEVASVTDDGKAPTPEQVEAYIIKMAQEGNIEEQVKATRYLIKLEKELALKEVEDKQTKAQREAEAAQAKADAEMKTLANDYVAYDAEGNPDGKSDLTLANKNGLLFKTALSLYNDKELHKEHYNDANVVQGFRRAVADAYREIHQQGLLTPKGETIVPRNPRQVLADPSAEIVEDAPTNVSNSLSDAEKARAEIQARNKNRFKR